jgi:polyhydroxyalkanoate synthase
MRLTRTRAARAIDLLRRPEPEVGLTPRDELLRLGTMRLYRYRPQAGEVYRVPLLLVMSLISKPYILDLVPGQSFVEYLLNQGFDVYMVDWGSPRPEDCALQLEDYVLERLPACVEEIQRVTGQREVSMLGYCMGGLFGLMYGALRDSPLKNLVCVATPVDFKGMTLLRQWADRRWFDVDRIVDAVGNIPSDVVLASLEFLRPMERTTSYLRLWDNLADDQYVYNWRVRYKWVNDQVAFPGACYRQMVKDLLWDNKLMSGDFILRNRSLDLHNLTAPVLHATAEFDHIAPAAATRPLTSLVGSSDTRDLHLRGGHVSLIAGANAILRLWPTVNEWLSVRST